VANVCNLAHEDLRQDERVMQLFGLVNTFLALDDLTAKNHLDIRQYSVIPLSHDTGLIEWVPHSDTLHELLKDYRKTHNLPIEAEHTYMQRFCTTPEYYKLTVFQKLEVLQYALERTPGNDLERIVWLGSHNSEVTGLKPSHSSKLTCVLGMVGQTYNVHAIIGGHVDGWIHSRSRRQTPEQLDDQPKYRQSRAH
jgi:FKBP12-rapamycin complex-associated protein